MDYGPFIVDLPLQMVLFNSYIQNPCWLMIVGNCTTTYIGDYKNPRTGNPELNQPGFHGMLAGVCTLPAFCAGFLLGIPKGAAAGRKMAWNRSWKTSGRQLSELVVVSVAVDIEAMVFGRFWWEKWEKMVF